MKIYCHHILIVYFLSLTSTAHADTIASIENEVEPYNYNNNKKFSKSIGSVNKGNNYIQKRITSLEGNNLNNALNYESRLQIILRQIRKSIYPAIKSIEKDIEEANINRCVLAVSNFLGAWFGVLYGLKGKFTPNKIPVGNKIQAGAQALYGYGYVTPFAFEYEKTRLDCGLKDFNEALEEYSFLDDPDPETSTYLLTYYTTKLNHEIKRKLNCILSKKGTNQEARVTNGLIDLYTELQQEKIAQ